jgi:hypothetical protein
MMEQMRNNKDAAPGLYECSAMSRSATATDPRDRIYGLLGIIQFRVAEAIMPDYSKSWPQVVAEATIVMISKEGLYPYMSNHFAFPCADCSQKGHRTPSWVLDFSREWIGDDAWIPTRYPGHKLAPEGIERRRKTLRLSEDFQILYAHGWYVGTITRTLTITPQLFARTLHEDNIRQTATLYDYYHDVLKPKRIAPSRLYNALNARLGCSQPLEKFSWSLVGHRDAFQLSFRYSRWRKHGIAVSITEEGDVGVTWLNNTFPIRADDLLVTLFGFQMPFILRPVQGDSTYRMVNLAYVSEHSDEFCELHSHEWRNGFDDTESDWVDNAAKSCPEYAIV